MKNPKLIITVLLVLLMLASVYIVIFKYRERQIIVFQQGMNYGYEQAITKLMQRAQTCQQVTINLGNQTLDMIAVDCLKQK